MRMSRWIFLAILVLSLLPWGAHLGARPGAQAAAQPGPAAQHTQMAVPRGKVVTAAAASRKRACRTALPAGACHMDCLPPTIGRAAGGGLLPRPPHPDYGVLVAGRSVQPVERPPTSL